MINITRSKSIKFVAVSLILLGAGLVAGVICWRIAFAQAPPSDNNSKQDQACTGFETEGRCADKCPAPDYLQGYDKVTGAAICNAPPTGCPWADHVPLGPECDKLAPPQAQPPAVVGEQFVGK